MSGTLARRRGWWRLIVVAVILLILGSYISPIRNYLEKTNSIQREQAAAEQLRAEHGQLQQEKESLQNASFVEQVARKDLGMVKPGEQPFVVKDLNSDDAAVAVVEPPAAEEEPLTDRIWNALGSLWP